MGKGRSPGKWFKNLLLGKKSSAKSTSSKKNDIFVPVSDSPVNSLLISPPIPGANDTKGVISEKEVVSRSSHDNNVLSTGDEEAKVKDVANFETQEDPEKHQLTEAAIKVQAACRSYLARRTFQTLKGAVQLQALIRGHLVRRQAVSALYCVKGIVKFQALARGYNVRRSDIGHAVQKICKDTHCSNSILVVSSTREEKVSENVFVCKLLASSPYAAPLSLTSDPGEPNFGWKWLEYWTQSHFWAPLPVLKNKSDSLSDEKNGSSQTVQRGQVKRTTRKSAAVKGDNSSVLANRSKQRPKKDSSHPLPSAQEHPQKETEKSSLEKKHAHNVSNGSEVVNEKRKISSRKILDHTVTDVLEQVPNASSEKMEDLTVAKSEESDPGKGHAQPAKDENCNEPHNDPIAVSRTSVKKGENEKNQGVGEDQNGGDDNCISNNCQRRASLPANFNDQDGEVYATPVTPRLPSYMAPTESAKAKLRGQNSPRFATDLVEKSSTTRRHSLSSSLNGRSGSFSPRAERLMAVSGRGVIKSDRSLSSSRDGTEKLIQPQWRR
ncbi:protein IQ-DOMAIN 29-like isoform X4 [Vigna umbellata]|uniref:protein IQ-DOMAIN 29-like isoform X3 n=1 Tax=Vigna umbellata TaxID=87088 RepID=UPI001F5F227D|nr:protein IQ-DOMAIN 29-like isoform X3 [Vigna umbellata]XP_047172863.1 protein IQ-DOMAIN 29-like isoform X4 [Vigna umbellata]